jgi:uncharacterized protein YoxC
MCAKKAFLFMVGALSITLDEINKSIKEAAQSIEGGRKKLNKRLAKDKA